MSVHDATGELGWLARFFFAASDLAIVGAR